MEMLMTTSTHERLAMMIASSSLKMFCHLPFRPLVFVIFPLSL